MSARSLYPRLFLPFAGILVIALLLAWWLATSLIGRTLERRLDQQLQHAVGVLADGGIPFTPELLERMSLLLRAEIVVLDAGGDVAMSTASATDDSLRAALAAIAHGDAPATRDIELRGEPFRLVAQPIVAERDARYRSVAAIASLADLRAATRRAAIWLGAAGLVLLALAGGLGHRVAYGITKPLGQLAQFAGHIAGGERSARVELEAPAEIEALADALNRMSGRLQDYERELVEHHRLAALGELAARVAHEIRNPLTAIKLQIELLAEQSSGATRRKLDALLDEVRRLELVVSTALAAGQPAKLAVRDDDLSRIADEVSALVRPQLEHRRIRLETVFCPIARAPLDASRIKQVLLNLIANASDAMPAGGGLRISTEQSRDSVALVVEDSGPGLSAAQRERLADGDVGNGIGLKLSRELVALHCGALDADTSPTLGGARFTVRLPVSTGGAAITLA